VSRRATAALLGGLILAIVCGPTYTGGQTAPSNPEFLRRAKSKVEPPYPELARRMNIVGTVKIEVVVQPNGVVKEARVVGGHPVLAGAALDAARKWRFEPASTESTGVIDFKFEPR
jgi:protein TonB